MMRLLITLLLFTTFCSAQDMVLVTDYTGHEINTPDSLSRATVKEYIFEMEQSGVNYEHRLRRIKAIELVGRDRTFVSELKKGVIYLNSRLNDFPYTKRAAILQVLGLNQGMKVLPIRTASVNATFNVTDDDEELFKKQNKRKATINKLKRLLE